MESEEKFICCRVQFDFDQEIQRRRILVQRISGFCANSLGVVATCSKAHVFQASGVTAAGAITHVASTSAGPGNATASWASNYLVTGAGNQYPEAFRLQTVIYYVAQGAQGAALFRKVFDGETTAPTGQELIENVESMQILYGRDTSTPADGIIDDYVTADAVTNWNAVVAVRIGLLLRSVSALAGDAKTSTSVSVNGQAITVPSSPKYDRRAFTTTIALRNRAKFIN